MSVKINTVRIIAMDNGRLLGQYLFKIDYKHVDLEYNNKVANNDQRFVRPFKYFDIIPIYVHSVELVEGDPNGKTILLINKGKKDAAGKSIEERINISGKTHTDTLTAEVNDENIKLAIAAVENPMNAESIIFYDEVALTRRVKELNKDIQNDIDNHALALMNGSKMIGQATQAMLDSCQLHQEELGIEVSL